MTEPKPLVFGGFMFKSARVREEWKSPKLDPMARALVMSAQLFAERAEDWPFVITCVYRTEAEDKELEGSGIHCVWRAVDVRTRGIDPGKVDAVVTYLNETWVYDPERPSKVVAYAKPHGNAPHLHVQSHANTTRREA